MRTLPRQDRRCGPCTLCCSLFGVDELDKPGGMKCVHQCSQGCRIYDARPPTCREFNCLWKLGHLPRQARPDKTGAVAARFDGQTVVAGMTRARADATVALLRSVGFDGSIEIIVKEAERAKLDTGHSPRNDPHAVGPA